MDMYMTLFQPSQGYFKNPFKPLLKLLAKNDTIEDSSANGDQVNQTGQSMKAAKLLVQSHHLLRVRRGVVALLTVAGFYNWLSKYLSRFSVGYPV